MREYIEKLGQRPRICVWELTLACNASCLHCGSHAGRPRDRELDTDDALRVARDLGALGCEHATLSGGEPLLRRDWPAICEALARAGVTVGMISNGLAFDAAEARRGAEAGLAHVAFSVDGLEASHDRMRGRPGGFSRVSAAFEAATSAGLPTCAVTHVNRWNIGELDEMHHHLAGLGVRSWKLQLCNPAGEAAGHREVILQPRDLLRLVPHIVRLRRRGLPFVETSDSIGYFGPYEEEMRRTWRKELPFWTGCYAGCRAIGIESGGNIKGCLALPSERHGTNEFVEGNVLAAGLADIWFHPAAFAYNRLFEPRRLTGFCRTCQYAAICRAGCHWTAIAHGGTMYENRYCYYRVASEEAAAHPGPRRWVVRGLAPAAIVAVLGVTACDHGLHLVGVRDGGSEIAESGDTAPDAVPDVAPPDAEAETPDASPDAEAETPDALPPHCPDPCIIDLYGVPLPYPPGCPYECGNPALCPTAEEACCGCDYGEPVPIPPGCIDPCVAGEYGMPPPVPDAGGGDTGAPGDAATPPSDAAPEGRTDAALPLGCPDPCEPGMCNDYDGPCPPPFPPGCPYICGSPEVCPTIEEVCCECDYGLPRVPPECEDPCRPPWWWRK